MSKTRGATIVNKEARQESSPGKQLLSAAMSRKLGLKEFMHNQEVLRFYRQVLRDIRKAPVDQQAELLSYVKHEFRSSAPTLDANKYLMSNGKQQYSIMKRALGIS